MDYKGYYAILEVSERANYQEIRRSYRNLARKYHPDRNNSSFAEDMIKKINAAFETLSDEQNRKQYDEMNYYELIAKEDTSSSNPAQTEPFEYEDNPNNSQTTNDYPYEGTHPDPTYNNRNQSRAIYHKPTGHSQRTVSYNHRAFTLYGIWRLRKTCSKSICS